MDKLEDTLKECAALLCHDCKLVSQKHDSALALVRTESGFYKHQDPSGLIAHTCRAAVVHKALEAPSEMERLVEWLEKSIDLTYYAGPRVNYYREVLRRIHTEFGYGEEQDAK